MVDLKKIPQALQPAGLQAAALQAARPPTGMTPPAGEQPPASIPDLWDQLFAQALVIQTVTDGLPQSESFSVESSSFGIYVQDAEVLAARNSASAMSLLWDRMDTLIIGMVKITLRHHRHVQKQDLEQEAWIVFAQSVERYDGRSRGAFWTYLRLSLHTRFRQFAAHDRVIPVPHDTRQKRAHWHKITQETFNARLLAQNLSYPDAETEGWSAIMTEGENNMENVVIEKMDLDIMKRKLQCLPRRWRDLLMLSQKYDDPDLALLLDEDEKHMVNLRIQIMDMLRSMPMEYYATGKGETAYLDDWNHLSESM
jgi:DNA-directed RNA polymerase specialized sigma24 family protein